MLHTAAALWVAKLDGLFLLTHLVMQVERERERAHHGSRCRVPGIGCCSTFGSTSRLPVQ